MIKFRSIFLKLLGATVGFGWGYYSINQGSSINNITGMIPILVGIILIVSMIGDIFKIKILTKEKLSKSDKKSKLYKYLSDARIYYALALICILVYVPTNDTSYKKSYFIGWDFVWYLDGEYSLNVTYFLIEFVFITILYFLFRKKVN